MSVTAYFKPRKMADLGSPGWVVIRALAIFIVSQLLASLIVTIGLSILHPGQDTANLLDNSVPAQFFYVLVAEGMAAGLVLLAVHQRRLNLGFIGLGRRPKLNDLWRAILGFLVFYGLLFIASVLVSTFLPSLNTNQQQQLGFNNIVKSSDNVLAFLALVVIPPFGEEPLMRGYLFSGLRSRWRFWPAAILTSVFFGLAHLEFGSGAPLLWAAGIDTFVLSIVLVYLRETSGALYAGMLVHLLNNLVAFGVHFK